MPGKIAVVATALCGLALGLWLMACGKTSCIGATPVPRLDSVTPTAIDSQTLPVAVILKGSGFVSWSTAYLNSVNLSSNTNDSHHIMVTITWQDLSAAGISTGTAYVSVSNAGKMMGDVFGCPNGGSTQLIPVSIN